MVPSGRTTQPSSSFVGREDERAWIRQCLGSGPARWVHFSAPGGWGKTALLHQLAKEHDAQWLDAASARSGLAALEAGSLALIDDYSPARLGSDGIQRMLAEVPSSALLVTAARSSSADRRALTPRSDLLSWRELAGLSASSTRELLANYGLDAELEPLLHLSGGHPRSLVEYATARHEKWLTSSEEFCLDFPEFTPVFLREHPRALALLGLSRVLRSDVIDHVLGPSAAEGARRWLDEHAFVRSMPGGWVASSLYRDEILRRVGLMNPSLVAEVRALALDWYADAIDRGGTYASRLGLATDWPDFLRGHEADIETFDGLHDPNLVWRNATEADRPLISRAVGASMGPRSADSVCQLIGLPHAKTLLLVDDAGDALSLFQTVDGNAVGPSQDACLEHLRARDVLANSCVVRAWLPLVPDPHPSVMPTTVARSAAEAFARPRLDRYLIIAQASADGARDWVARNYLVHFEDLGFTLDNRRFEVIGYDFREKSAGEHMREAAQRLLQLATASQRGTVGLAETRESVSLHDVRDALLAFGDDSRLGRCALSQHVAQGEPPARAAERVRALIRRACDDLRDEDARALIEKAYFERTQKQRALADDLGMSYSTFRRHLSRAVENLTLLVDAQDQTGCRDGL